MGLGVRYSSSPFGKEIETNDIDFWEVYISFTLVEFRIVSNLIRFGDWKELSRSDGYFSQYSYGKIPLHYNSIKSLISKRLIACALPPSFYWVNPNFVLFLSNGFKG